MRWVCVLTILTAVPGAVCAQPAGVTAVLCRWPGGAAEATPYEAAGDLARVAITEEGPLRTRVESALPNSSVLLVRSTSPAAQSVS